MTGSITVHFRIAWEVACGLLLLVVPGVYLAVRYAPFGYVIGSRQVSGLAALHEAEALTQRPVVESVRLPAVALVLLAQISLGRPCWAWGY